MNIHIIFPFQNGPYGGGNQFLKALREKFREINHYAETPEKADIFLFNSFQDISHTLRLKRKFPKTLFVHRMDGPISLYRNSQSKTADYLVFSLNNAIADATIFQSNFSQKENLKLGMRIDCLEKIISNASDPHLFYPKNGSTQFNNRKIKLISTSWSSNLMKGFDTYTYLDEHLDFSNYEYIFIGNAPVSFKNITVLPPQSSKKIAELLRASDIYITASKKDPCSNSLIEALSCKLPAVALNDGGHPELIQTGGELFDVPEEIPEKIKKISNNYTLYQEKIPIFSIKEKAEAYINFFQCILDKKNTGYLITKHISPLKQLLLSLKAFFERI